MLKEINYYLALLFEHPPANRATTNQHSRESQSSRTLFLVGVCITLILAKLKYPIILVTRGFFTRYVVL